ncbi:MAG: DNA-directed RNA polymerase subunit alpha, partial [Chloroflexota bacterium]
LLGYLPGAAVTHVRLDGVQHEFTTIEHVKEDVTEFLLNVKALRLRPVSGQPGKLEMEMAGKKEVLAADIKPTTDFEIVNPELHLATLDSPEARLYVEFDVELGVGYREAEPSDNLPIGTIPVDAIFTPVRKVNFSVEPTHIGQETSRERLNLEIWTDRTISPIDALSKGAGILIEQLSPFANYAKIFQLQAEKEHIPPSIPDEQYNMPVEQLNLSVRTMNCLRRAGITTVGELLSRGEKELMTLRNFGQKSRQEIEERLNEMGQSLASSAAQEAADDEPGSRPGAAAGLPGETETGAAENETPAD